MITLRYDLHGAWEEGITRHPINNMIGLGVTYKQSESIPMSDCWIFYDCSHVPDCNYIEVISREPSFKGSFLNGLTGEVS